MSLLIRGIIYAIFFTVLSISTYSISKMNIDFKKNGLGLLIFSFLYCTMLINGMYWGLLSYLLFVFIQWLLTLTIFNMCKNLFKRKMKFSLGTVLIVSFFILNSLAYFDVRNVFAINTITLILSSLPVSILAFFPFYILGKSSILNDDLVTKTKNFVILAIKIITSIIFLYLARNSGFGIFRNQLLIPSQSPHPVSSHEFNTIFYIITIWMLFIPLVLILKEKIDRYLPDNDLSITLKNDLSNFSFYFCIAFLIEFSFRTATGLRVTLNAGFTFNVLILFAIILLITSIFGKGLGFLVVTLSVLFFAVAYYFRLTFHDEIFRPWDIHGLSEGLAVLPDLVNLPLIISIGVSFLLLLTIIGYKKRKKIKVLLKPSLQIFSAICAVIIVFQQFSMISQNNMIGDVRINTRRHLSGRNNVVSNGFTLTNIHYFSNLNEMRMSTPDNYSKELVIELLNQESLISTDESDEEQQIRPHVVAVMLEAFMDPTALENYGIEISGDATYNLRNFQTGDVIVPAFGGETANVEFEFLTGVPLYFFPGGVVPYTQLISNARMVPNMATTMNDLGYATYVLHQNRSNFYNRNVVYSSMMFDTFLCTTGCQGKAFETRTNIELTDVIIDTLKESEEPVFIFAITIENHGPSNSRWEREPAPYPEISVESDYLALSQRNQLASYMQGVYSDDLMIGNLIDFVETFEEPTIVVFFGDHLPPLRGIFNELDFLTDSYNMFTTPFVIYSNFTEIEQIAEPIGVHYLSMLVKEYAGIPLPSHLNFIANIIEDYPIIHRTFTHSDDSQTLNDLRIIIYDIMFGGMFGR